MRLHFVDRSTYRRKAEPDDRSPRCCAAAARDGRVRRPGGRQQRPRRTGLPRARRGAARRAPTSSRSPAAPAAPSPAWPRGSPRGSAPWASRSSRAASSTADDTGPPARGVRRPARRLVARRPLPLRRLRPHHPRTGRLRRRTSRTGTALPVERLYVAKMLYGLVALADEGAFPRGTTVAAVVTRAPLEPLTAGPRPAGDARTPTTGHGRPVRADPAASLRLPVGRRLLQVQPAQQRPQHLVVDVARRPAAARTPRARRRSSPGPAAGRCRRPTRR